MKTIIVFGSSSELGTCFCNDIKNLNVVRTYYKHDNGGIKCDILNENDVKSIFEYTKNKFGNIDYVINFCTYSYDNDILEKSYDEFKRVVDVNLGGTFIINKYCGMYMENGMVINISSSDGINTYSPISMDYCAAKAGVINLTRNLALRFNNIKFICVCPNWINTTSTLSMDKHYLENELKRIGQDKLLIKEDVSKYLISLLDSDIESGTVEVI